MIPFIICDNKEAYSLANLKAGKTHRPCRICRVDRNNVNQYLYDDTETGNTRRPWEDYRDFNRINKAINDKDQEFLGENSCHTLFPSVFPMYPNVTGGLNHSRCSQHLLFPPDMLHTVSGGAIRYAVIWILEIIKKIDVTNSKIAELNQHILNFDHGQSSDGEFDFAIPGIVSSLFCVITWFDL